MKIFMGFMIFILVTNMIYAQSAIIKLAYSNTESFPYQIGDDDKLSNPPGIAVEIVQEAAKVLGQEIVILRYPNKRVLEELKLGKIDGAFQYSFKEDRLTSGAYPLKEGKLDSSRRLSSMSYYFYKNKDSDLLWDGKSFNKTDIIVGGNSGYSIVDDLIKMGLKVEEAKTTEQNLGKLLFKRIDAFSAQDVTTELLLTQKKYQSIVKMPSALSVKDYFLMFSHQFIAAHAEKAEKFWTKIGEIRDAKTNEVKGKYQEEVTN